MNKTLLHSLFVLFGVPGATAFLNYLLNTSATWPPSKDLIWHAALATGLVELALLKQSPLGQVQK